MTLRISTDTSLPGRRLCLHGRLTESEVGELADQAGGDPSSLTIDVTDLLSADAAGLATLRRLRDAGAELRGASPFIALLLEDGNETGDSPARKENE